jgi:hypothetical protein
MLLFRKIKFRIGSVYRYLTRPWYQFSVSIDKITNIFACSYDDNGWHPILETLREYDMNKDIKLENTSLYKYHDNFKPSKTRDLLTIKIDCELPLFIYPWGSFSNGSLNTNKNPRKSRFCGPSDLDFISKEFDSIIELYNRVKTMGYQPEAFPNSYIGGTFLKKKDGDFRFVVMQGNHRAAVLSFLGYEKVAVRLSKQALFYVNEKDLLKWPAVKNNLCTAEDAQKIFNSFFDENGHHIKSKLYNI